MSRVVSLAHGYILASLAGVVKANGKNTSLDGGIYLIDNKFTSKAVYFELDIIIPRAIQELLGSVDKD